MSNVDSLSVGLQQIWRARLALVALAAAASCLLVSALLAPAPAAAACPNEVFRSGPSAKLPDCRAYELVTPAYTGGLQPGGTNFSNMWHGFDFDLMTDAGNSVVFNTTGGALSGTPGNGFNDRYRAVRTATGWVSELAGPTAVETTRLTPGPVSPDHGFSFLNAGLNEFALEPESTLQAPFGGRQADYLRKPNGEFELIGTGSLGSSREATGRLITAGGSHVIFSGLEPLEPEASPADTLTIYDRPATGTTTHVVSLLPGDVTPTAETHGDVEYLGVSTDGSEVVFATRPGNFGEKSARWFVRVDNSETREVARTESTLVGDELSCEGGGADTLAYQWLRNGVPIGGATSADYTATAADAGAVVQCQVEAIGSEGKAFQTNMPPRIVAPFEGKEPPYLKSGQQPVYVKSAGNYFVEVGEEATCETGPSWRGDPTFSYQWLRNGTVIPGATGVNYTTLPADDGASLICRVAAANADGTTVSYSSPKPVYNGPPTTALGEGPTISNVTDPGDAPEVGDQLSCSPGTWSESPSFSYQWLRNGAPIGGATASTYTTTAADEGTNLQCEVTATAGRSTQALSNELVADPQPAVAPPASETWSNPGYIFGEGQVGEQLGCSEGSWSGEPTITFQWMRDAAPIPGATESSYTPTVADLDSVIQCRVIATNAGGSAAATSSRGEDARPRVITAGVPNAFADVPVTGMIFGGIYGGHVFYGDQGGRSDEIQVPGDLFSSNVATGAVTRITDVGDARFSHVSRDGSHVYFVSESEIGGEGTVGQPNLYVWSRADDSTTYITTVKPADVELRRNSQGQVGANLASWTFAQWGEKESIVGLGASDTRSTPDGSVFSFQTTAQLTSFNNTETAPEDCRDEETSGEACIEIYLYDTASEQLTCVSCPPQGSGPATGEADFYEWGIIGDINAPNNLTVDGNMVVFETTEDLLPQDGNGRKDVYRWKRGEGLALISTGQAITPSSLYAVSPSGNDITILTTEKLVPHDENGGTARLYDARVNGGFPPDEETVTEPCTGDACQGNPKAAPEAPSIPSTSLNGGGNVKSKLKCPKGKRKVVRKGKERCVKRKHQKRHKKAGAKRGAAR